VQQVLGDRAVGVCDSPSGMCRRVARALGRDPADLWFDYFGLNHLGWLQGVRDAHGASLLDGLLEDDERLQSFEEGRLFGGEWLRALGMIPNEYLYYFYYAADTVDAIRSGHPRGAFLLEQQRAFYAQNGQDAAAALAAWRATRHDRERTYMAEARSAAGDPSEHDNEGNAGYEAEAMAVLEAMALNRREVRILNTANRSALPFLDDRAVVEVPCVVGRTGPVPLAMGAVPAHARALVETMKDVERTTIDAALLGSRELAVKALALHPLVPSVRVAREIFDGYRARLPALQEAFPG
jgi:6-phospho-beta-glucosidase